MKRIISLVLCALLAAALFPAFPAFAGGAPGGEFVPDEVIIRLYDISRFPGREADYDDGARELLMDVLAQIDANTYVVRSEEFLENPDATLDSLNGSELVEYAEPNYIVTASLDSDTGDDAALAEDRGMGAMRDVVSSVPTVVAVLDTGVFAEHSGLAGRVRAGYDFVSGKPGADFDDNGHGTAVAGIIAARENSGSGAAGVNRGAVVLPVKVLDSTGTGTASNVARGLYWAADNGARIINLSLGAVSDSQTLRAAVDYAVSKGCVVVASAGNTGRDRLEYPARYENVIGVGAETGGERDSMSCYGRGLDILTVGLFRTTGNAGETVTAQGTSVCAAQVSGALSLALELYPDMDIYGAKELISRAAADVGESGWDAQTGGGILDYSRIIETAREMGANVQAQYADSPVISAIIEESEVPLAALPTRGADYTVPLIICAASTLLLGAVLLLVLRKRHGR